jgi:hypothetical protein
LLQVGSFFAPTENHFEFNDGDGHFFTTGFDAPGNFKAVQVEEGVQSVHGTGGSEVAAIAYRQIRPAYADYDRMFVYSVNPSDGAVSKRLEIEVPFEKEEVTEGGHSRNVTVISFDKHILAYSKNKGFVTFIKAIRQIQASYLAFVKEDGNVALEKVGSGRIEAEMNEGNKEGMSTSLGAQAIYLK